MGALFRRGGRGPSLYLAAAMVAVLALAGCWVDLGAPEGVTSPVVVDVNSDGTVLVARQPFGLGANDAYVVDSNGEWTELGYLPDGYAAWPAAINDDGVVVGISFMRDPEVQELGFHVPFIWDEVGGMRPLMAYPPSPEWLYTEVQDLSDDGDVVGTRFPGQSWHMDLTTGQITILEAPAGYSEIQAWAVNDAGVIVGDSYNPASEDSVPTVWAPPTYQPVTLDLMSAESGSADDIDGDGTVVGTLWHSDGTTTVAYWEPGTFQGHEIPLEDVEFPAIAGIDDGMVVVGGAIWDIPTGTFDQLDPENSYLSAIDGPYLAGELRIEQPDGSLVSHVGRWDRPTYD